MQLKNVLATAAFVAALVLLTVSYSFSKDKDESVTLRGEISDSQCAFNVHSDARSHEWMIKKGVEGANDARSCTLHCAKDLGGKYVLVSKDEVYRLDDQMEAEKFAGLKVKATGSIDSKTKTMRVTRLEADK
jgi:hypothetical protein